MEKIYNDSYFVEGSKVLTESGVVPIEKVKEGDLVLTYDNEFKMVSKVEKKEIEDIYEVETFDGSKIQATGNQFVSTSQKKKGIYSLPQRKQICKLDKNDFLVEHFEKDGSGHIYYQYDGVKSVTKSSKKQTGYNLIVSDQHTFVVDSKIVFDNSMMVKKK